MVNGWKCYAAIITSILTQQREFQALCGMPHLPQPVVNQILNPLPPVKTSLTIKKIGLSPEHEKHLIRKFNSAQQEAVTSAAMRKSIFTLVQVGSSLLYYDNLIAEFNKKLGLCVRMNVHSSTISLIFQSKQSAFAKLTLYRGLLGQGRLQPLLGLYRHC